MARMHRCKNIFFQNMVRTDPYWQQAPGDCITLKDVTRSQSSQGPPHKWGRFINKKRGEKNKNRGERQKNSENQVTLDGIFGASKKHYLSNFAADL
jgi:hypothetical protein